MHLKASEYLFQAKKKSILKPIEATGRCVQPLHASESPQEASECSNWDKAGSIWGESHKPDLLKENLKILMSHL